VAGTDALAGRRVFVTGATGFLGSHLTHRLAASGVEVHALVRGLARRASVHARVIQHPGDMTHADSIRAAVAFSRPDVVFHLAASGTTSADGADAARMLDVNVAGAERLWAALEGFRGRVVQTGTCAEYAARSGALAEDAPCAPMTEYSRTVHEAVLRSLDVARRTGREVAILRPFGPYGPGDRPERLIPFVIEGLLGNGRVGVTAGPQRRDFSYVDDHVDALVAAATAPLAGGGCVYNIGSGHPISVRDLVKTIASHIGGHAIDRVDFGALSPRPGDAEDRYADIAAARRDLGFSPRVSLDEGLTFTIQAARATREAAPR